MERRLLHADARHRTRGLQVAEDEVGLAGAASAIVVSGRPHNEVIEAVPVMGAAGPTCGRMMKPRAVVRGPDTGRVLAGLERAARAPPARAAVAIETWSTAGNLTVTEAQDAFW